MFGKPDKGAIFRKVALERLSTPDQLDQLMQVITPRGWIALITMIVLVSLGLIWAIWGSIPTRVPATGILLTSAGVQDVVALSSGVVTEIIAKPGDMVQKGENVARISQPDLLDQIATTRAKLEEMKSQNQKMKEAGVKSTELQLELLDKQRENLQQSIEILEERKAWLEEKISNQEKLLTDGLITKQALLYTKQDLQSVDGQLEGYKSQLKELSVKELQLSNQREQETLTNQLRINDVERTLTTLEARLEENSRVQTSYTGRILEVKVTEGDLVTIGTSIISIEPLAKEQGKLQALIYVPMKDGKKVKSDMIAQITPTTVKRAEYGFIQAEVKSVAAFPSTFQGMMRVFSNAQLVQTLMAGGAPIEAYAELTLDNESPSGYQWSSGKGPDISITSGTMCEVFIVVKKQRPISMVIPLIKEKTGIY